MTDAPTPLDGRFELLDRLTDQGYGEVYKARDLHQRKRVVAVKRLRAVDGAVATTLDATWPRVKAFRHGAVLALLHHGTADGRPYLVHELFEGPSLAAGLAQTWREGALLPRALLERLAERLGAALRAAHAQTPPLVHGGLHPGCVLLRRASPQHFDLRIVDFGVAGCADAPGDPSRSGVFGAATPVPTPGVTDDIAGLGRVLRALFAAPAGPGEDPAPVGRDWRRDDLPDAVWDVVDRAMTNDPARRFDTVGDMMRELDAAWSQPVTGSAARPNTQQPSAPTPVRAATAVAARGPLRPEPAMATPTMVSPHEALVAPSMARPQTTVAPRGEALPRRDVVPASATPELGDAVSAFVADDVAGHPAAESPEAATVAIALHLVPSSPWDIPGFDTAKTECRAPSMPAAENPWATDVLQREVSFPAAPDASESPWSTRVLQRETQMPRLIVPPEDASRPRSPWVLFISITLAVTTTLLAIGAAAVYALRR